MPASTVKAALCAPCSLWKDRVSLFNAAGPRKCHGSDHRLVFAAVVALAS